MYDTLYICMCLHMQICIYIYYICNSIEYMYIVYMYNTHIYIYIIYIYIGVCVTMGYQFSIIHNVHQLFLL